MTLYSVIISKNIKYVVPPKLMLCCNTSITLKSFKFFIYLYLTVLGLHCSTGFSLVVASKSFSLAVVQQLLIVLVFLGVEHRLWDPGASVVAARGCNSCSFRALEYRLSRCGPGAWLLPSTWNLPLSGIKPMSPSLAGDSLPLSYQGSPSIILSFFSILIIFFKKSFPNSRPLWFSSVFF